MNVGAGKYRGFRSDPGIKNSLRPRSIRSRRLTDPTAIENTLRRDPPKLLALDELGNAVVDDPNYIDALPESVRLHALFLWNDLRCGDIRAEDGDVIRLITRIIWRN